jgi:3-oxoacyl-[acyl-carrier protein] reductase
MEKNLMSKLQGKVAVVTGASKGIGAAIARQFGTEGASVVVNYASSKAEADKVVADITAKGGKAIAVRADLSKPLEITKLFEETKRTFGKLDILVNNAGIYASAPLEDITEEHYKKHFDLNVLGLILASQEAAKLIGPEGGSIINISSTITSITPPNFAVYAGTKGAVDTITRTLAKELGPRKIRVNAINPGMVVTEGVQAAGYDKGDMRTYLESITPLGRIGQPEDIAPAAVFFASQDSSWITGEVLRVAGGVR